MSLGMSVRERYTLKLKSGHKVKIRQNETYYVNLGDLKLTFQEQPWSTNQGVHTHIWIEAIDDVDTTRDIYDYVLWHLEKYPRKTSMQALVIGWELNEEENEFDGPDVLYEIIVDRKFSQTMINDITFWAQEIYDIVMGHVSMRSLFGEQVEF